NKLKIVVGSRWYFLAIVLFGRWKLLVIGCLSTSNQQLPTTPNSKYQQLPTAIKYYDQKVPTTINTNYLQLISAINFSLIRLHENETEDFFSGNILLFHCFFFIKKISNDSFLKWNPKDYGNVSQLYVKSSMIWTPDIIIMDSAEEKLFRGYRDNYLIIVNSAGKIRWHYQTLSKSFCAIDVMNFPFDEQTCSLNLRSSARDKNMLRIIKRNVKAKVMENIKTEWFIVNSTVEETSIILTKNSNNIEYTVLKFSLKLRRVTTHYFLKIIFPFTIIASITLFTFWLAPDSGEKLTLDVTILLSLVFYLQITSDYIPRGFSKIPILTLFTLTNFSLVFLSCVFTVMVLRLYYKSPSYLSPHENQLPFGFRLILFKYIGPFLCLKFYLRKRDELYHANSNLVRTKDRQRKKSAFCMNRNLSKCVMDFEVITNKGTAEMMYQNTNQLLNTLRLLNRCMRINMDKDMEDEPKVEDFFRKEKVNLERSLYYEEWKQAALVLDRLFFVIFSICMPMTTMIFFRTNFYEYITSNRDTNENIQNLNC
ncbi:neuronal acetylcholine receptor subunit alpha-6, partial [Brachionus plicatilis]